jgi:transposase InsO family protein
MDNSFCLGALEDALRNGRPEIFNTDQGAQFTSAAFIDTLETAGVRISMDRRGRWLDNSSSKEPLQKPSASDRHIILGRVDWRA